MLLAKGIKEFVTLPHDNLRSIIDLLDLKILNGYFFQLAHFSKDLEQAVSTRGIVNSY